MAMLCSCQKFQTEAKADPGVDVTLQKATSRQTAANAGTGRDSLSRADAHSARGGSLPTHFCHLQGRRGGLCVLFRNVSKPRLQQVYFLYFVTCSSVCQIVLY